MTRVIYDRERDLLKGTRKTYVKRILFQLLDLEDYRSVIEDIAKREEGNDVKAVECYKDSPVLLNKVKYNAALVKIGHALDITPDKEDDEKVLKVLKETRDKIGKKFGVKIDVIEPFTHRNFLCYSLK